MIVRRMMRLPEKLSTIGEETARLLYTTLPFQGVTRPVFILGCGRSGTTIFGTILSQHREITYLNEPRHLWSAAYPETDIWSLQGHARQGKLVLTAADAEPGKSQKLSRLFRFETLATRRPILVEKLPINNFRLNFIHQIFPDARFIHIYRNALEVARSIETLCKQGHWFAGNPYKWERLVEYALSRDETAELPELCGNDFERGLLEWRLSSEAAVECLSRLPEDAFFELSYEELIHSPSDTIAQVLEFIGLANDSAVNQFVVQQIRRRTNPLHPSNLAEKERILGGKLLPLSMDGGKGLTRRWS